MDGLFNKLQSIRLTISYFYFKPTKGCHDLLETRLERLKSRLNDIRIAIGTVAGCNIQYRSRWQFAAVIQTAIERTDLSSRNRGRSLMTSRKFSTFSTPLPPITHYNVTA